MTTAKGSGIKPSQPSPGDRTARCRSSGAAANPSRSSRKTTGRAAPSPMARASSRFRATPIRCGAIPRIQEAFDRAGVIFLDTGDIRDGGPREFGSDIRKGSLWPSPRPESLGSEWPSIPMQLVRMLAGLSKCDSLRIPPGFWESAGSAAPHRHQRPAGNRTSRTAILEESTVAALRPAMGVFNNLVIYNQDGPQGGRSTRCLPRSTTSWSPGPVRSIAGWVAAGRTARTVTPLGEKP